MDTKIVGRWKSPSLGASELSTEAYQKVAIYLSERKANNAANDVHESGMIATQAKQGSNSVQGLFESSHHNPDTTAEENLRLITPLMPAVSRFFLPDDS